MRNLLILLGILGGLPAWAQPAAPPATDPTSSSPHQLEASAGFLRGDWKADGVVRSLAGLDVHGAWRYDPWRVSLSARMLTSIRDDAGECGDMCDPERAADERHDPMGALTVGWYGTWGGGQAGVALLGKDTEDIDARLKIRPALLFRGGPERLHLSGSLWEPSAQIPAPGRTRLGIGSDLGRVHAWLGAATDETQRIGVALGVRAALFDRLSFSAGTAISPTPSEMLLIRAGLVFVLGGDPPWTAQP